MNLKNIKSEAVVNEIKIGLITIHATTNYGGVFQAFATQEILKEYGDTELIDYRNSFVDKTIQRIRYGRTFRDVLRIAKDLCRLRSRSLLIDKFENFFDEEYLLTKRVNSIEELERLSNRYDVVVCGSDQIWNPACVSGNNTLDTHYLLDFVKKSKKVSYASSIGSYDFSKNKKNEVKFQSLISDFDSLSIREHRTKGQVSSYVSNSVYDVLDPTLLLDKNQWVEKFSITESAGDYILVYALKKDKLFCETIKYVSMRTGLKVIVVDQDPVLGFKADTHHKSLPPKEFLALFMNSRYVVTNSFHGCAFSINFNKNFIVSKPPASPNRVIDLLEKLGAKNQLVLSNNDFSDDLLQDVLFQDINKKLLKYKNESKAFLDEAIRKN